MSPRATPPRGSEDPEPRHSDLLRAFELGLRALEVRAEERHDAVLQRLDAGDARFERIEKSMLELATDQAEAKGKAEAAAGRRSSKAGSPRERLKDWVTIGSQVIVGVGALGGFFMVAGWALEALGGLLSWAARIAQHFGPPMGPHH